MNLAKSADFWVDLGFAYPPFGLVMAFELIKNHFYNQKPKNNSFGPKSLAVS